MTTRPPTVRYDATRRLALAANGSPVFAGSPEGFERWLVVNRARPALATADLPPGRARCIER